VTSLLSFPLHLSLCDPCYLMLCASFSITTNNLKVVNIATKYGYKQFCW